MNIKKSYGFVWKKKEDRERKKEKSVNGVVSDMHAPVTILH